jgi:uncharacterized protein YegP (UPF0339 family)
MILIKKSKDKQFYAVVKARNGKVLFQTETYRRRAGAMNAIKSLKKALEGDIKDVTS